MKMRPLDIARFKFCVLKLGWLSAASVVFSATGLFGFQAQVQAQVQAQSTRPDTSLGTESSILTPAGTTLNGQAADVVEGGVERGNTLFHSFSTLNVGAQQQLYFSPSDRITHIFTRVTGNTPSQILGTLGVLGTADLLLLNPNGLLFGPDAQLDINGSFFATSADKIAFGEGFSFSARSPNLPPPNLLTIQPTALFFTRTTPAPITVQGTLSVNTGERVQLVGGDINLTGNFSESRRDAIAAPQGIIELTGLAEPGTLALSPDGLIQLAEEEESDPTRTLANLSLANLSLANLSLANLSLADARITVAGEQNGNITLYANNLTLEDTRIIAGFGNRSGTRQSQAGDITLVTQGNLTATDGTFISNGIRNFSLGNSGDTLITVGENLLLNDAKILTLINDSGDGTGGNVTVNVAGNAQLQNDSAIGGRLNGNGQLQTVNITVAGDLHLDTSDLINDVTDDGNGDAGDLNIQASVFQIETPDDTPGDLQSLVSTSNNGSGQAGTLSVNAQRLVMIGPGRGGPSGITANAGSRTRESSGNAGAIFINVTEDITLTQRGKIESIATDTTGRSNNISINAAALSLTDFSSIVAINRRSVGAPGNIAITVAGNLNVADTSSITTAIDNESTADRSLTAAAGNITLQAGSLTLSGLGGIRTETRGDGDAGDINIVANTIGLDDPYTPDEGVESASGLFSRTRPTATGNGGSITLQTDQLRVNGNAVITTETENRFPGGDIRIAANRVELTGGGQILTTASDEGEAGDITLLASNEVALLGNDPVFAAQLENAEARLAAGRISDLRQVLNRRGNNGVAPSGIYLQSLGDGRSAGAAGNLLIQERVGGNLQLILKEGGEINADTINTTGGNIVLSGLDTVLLREGSRITAEAGSAQQMGNGGNITLTMPDGFLIAVPTENSNIVANAFEGNGGNIDIIALGILGLDRQSESQSESQSNTASMPLSRISASSEFGQNGAVNTQTLTVDPSQGLIELPTNLADQSNQVAQRCTGDRGGRLSAFVITGQGGIQPAPADIVRNETAGLIDLGTLSNKPSNEPISTEPLETEPLETGQLDTGQLAIELITAENIETAPSAASLPEIFPVEAQNWQRNAQGEIRLIAQAPQRSVNNRNQTPSCVHSRSAQP